MDCSEIRTRPKPNPSFFLMRQHGHLGVHDLRHFFISILFHLPFIDNLTSHIDSFMLLRVGRSCEARTDNLIPRFFLQVNMIITQVAARASIVGLSLSETSRRFFVFCWAYAFNISGSLRNGPRMVVVA